MTNICFLNKLVLTVRKKKNDFTLRTASTLILAGCCFTIHSKAQTIASYNFSELAGTYTALPAPVTLFTSTDNTVSSALTIPFTFNYNGTNYTACKVSSNGFLTIGGGTADAADYTPISSTTNPLDRAIAALGADLVTTAKYQTLGTSPNQVFVVEWSGYRWTVGSGESINMQVRLYQTTNVVEVQYGTITTTNTAFTTGAAQVGLKGGAAVYNNVTFTNATLTGYPYTNNWNSLVTGALQADVVGITSAIKPASGTILRWTPSACAQVTTAATVSSITSSSALVSWTNSGTYASGYRVRWRKVDDTYSATTWSTPVPVAAGSSSYTITGLTSATYYVFSVEGLCSSSSANNYSTVTTTNTVNGKGLFTTTCVNATLTYTQGFNAATVPSCWSTSTIAVQTGTKISFVTTGSNPATSPYESTHCVLYNSYSNTNGGAGSEERFVCVPLTTTGIPSVDVDFYWRNENYSSYNAGAYLNEGVQLQYSINGGGTWINTGSFIPRHDGTLSSGTTQWNRKVITLPAAAGNIASLLIGFKFHSEYGDNCFLDKVTVKATPPCNFAGTTAVTTSTFCGTSGSTTLSAVDYAIAGTFQWQYSSDNFVSDVHDLASGTNPASANTGTLSATRYFRLRGYCASLGTFQYSNIVTVTVINPQVSSSTGATRCGIGTVSLQATPSSGSTLYWYNAASAGSLLGTGNPFTTPSISATTNFYVSAGTAGSGTVYVGPAGPVVQGGTIGTQYTSWNVYFDVLQSTTLVSIDVFPIASGQSATLRVYNSSGTLLGSYAYTTTVSGGNTTQTIPINLPLTPATGYSIDAPTLPSSGLSRNTSNAVYPYTSSVANITGNAYDDTYFLCYYNFRFSVGCESGRTVVTATVTPPPAIALGNSAATICSGSSTTVNVTAATIGNFTSYSWSPATGVAASGFPAGSTASLSPASTTTYTISGTSSTGCVNQANIAITVNPAPPVTVGAAVCSGTNATITSSSSCDFFTDPRTTITGNWSAATDPVAIQPVIFLPNSVVCEFDADGHTMNYTKISFQVSVSGTYNFTMANNTYDGMGYIVTGAFVPGTCPGAGTWVVGDDDSGPGLMPLMDASLVTGVTYTLITTVYSPSSGTTTGPYTWNITPPPGGQIVTGTTGAIQWWNAASGGSVVGTGNTFNPIPSVIPSNTSVGSYTFYAACSNNSTCRTATGYVIGTTGQWIGGTSSDWSTLANWCGAVPIISTDATISPGAPNMPVLGTGTGAVRNLTVNNGALLTVSNAIMQIAGIITANNTINASAGTIELAGSATQAISGSSFTNRSIQNVKASNSVNVSAAVNDSLKITGALSFGNVNSKVFSSGNNVILVSSATATARVADITNNGVNSGNSFTGNFQVQRYIPARRAWRLMTAPIAAGAQTIKQAWQEGVGGAWASNPSPGYGTHITGGPARTTVQGYDQGPFNPSIYGHTATGWNYLPATTNELITSNQGWLLFVRGSRAINLPLSTPATAPDVTVLRPTGAIKYGIQPTLTNSTGGYMVVGNPYPSPINFKNISRTGVIGGIGGNNAYYLWDPALGGASGVGAYVTFSWNGTAYDKSIVVGGGSSNIGTNGMIPSSAAFLVNQSVGGTVSIEENDKDTVVYTPTYVFRPTANPSSLRVSLYGTEPDSSKGILDGTLISFHESSSTAVDNEDAVKMNNVKETFTIIKNGTKIAIERRNMLQVNDTLFYKMWNMRQRNYEFEVALTNVELPAGTAAFFEDTYLRQKTMLNYADTTRISFDVTNDSASTVQDRFRIVIGSAGVVPVTFTDVKAYEIGDDINVEWIVQNELNIVKYEIERSLDGINFSSIKSANPRGGNVTYNSLDENPVTGNNYYRIKSIDNTGRIKYSRIVKVYVGKGKPAITVYPNPVTDDVITIAFSNVSPGVYTVKLYNAVGQFVFAKQITHTESSSSHTIRLDGKTAKAVYQLEVTSQEGNKNVFKLVLQ